MYPTRLQNCNSKESCLSYSHTFKISYIAKYEKSYTLSFTIILLATDYLLSKAKLSTKKYFLLKSAIVK